MSPEFAIGMMDRYFAFDVPMEFTSGIYTEKSMFPDTVFEKKCGRTDDFFYRDRRRLEIVENNRDF